MATPPMKTTEWRYETESKAQKWLEVCIYHNRAFSKHRVDTEGFATNDACHFVVKCFSLHKRKSGFLLHLVWLPQNIITLSTTLDR